MTQFTVTITRHLTSCSDNITGTVEVIATPATAIDPEERYVLEGSGFWGTSDITSALAANGTSTGLNAQSTDSTATVISNVVATLGQVAVGAATFAAPADGSPPPPHPPICSDKTRSAVISLYPPKGSPNLPLKAIVDNDTAALAETTARVTLLTTESGIDAARKPLLLAALDRQSTQQATLTAHTTAFTKALAATTDTQVVTWPKLGSATATTTPFLLDNDVLHGWAPGANVSDANTEFAVYFALFLANDADNGWHVPATIAAADIKVGVPVRLGRVARLVICRKAACTPDQADPGIKSPLVTASTQTVLQLGQVYTVPATGGTFKAETAVISLDANGLPTSIEVAEKSSVAVALSGAAKDAATQVAALPAQVAAARLASTQAKTNQLNANIALATAQANANVAGQSSGFAAQTSLINAQTALDTAKLNAGLPVLTAGANDQAALLSAQAALVTAQANANVIDQTGALTAQTSLLNAQTAQINAAAALAKAKATSAAP
jgi:hypothetical protein